MPRPYTIEARLSLAAVSVAPTRYFFFPIFNHFRGSGPPSLSHGFVGVGGGGRFGGSGSHGPFGTLKVVLFGFVMSSLLLQPYAIRCLLGSKEPGERGVDQGRDRPVFRPEQLARFGTASRTDKEAGSHGGVGGDRPSESGRDQSTAVFEVDQRE